jgi:hypothetical protein
MRAMKRAFVWLAVMLFAAGASADEAAWMTRLDELETQQLWKQPRAVELALEALELDADAPSRLFTHLSAEKAKLAGKRLHCLLLAKLARTQKRPESEILAADDLLLQSAPDLPQGWLGRAEHYLASTDKSAPGWAAEAAAQALRRVRFQSEAWREDLRGETSTDWLAHGVKNGHFAEWVKALASALSDAPRAEARLDAHALVLAALRQEDAKKKAAVCEMLIESVMNQQPQLVLGDPANFEVLMRNFELAGLASLARAMARALVLAEWPREVAEADADEGTGTDFTIRWLSQNSTRPAKEAQALRNGHHELVGLWETTTPRYLPATLARQVLRLALLEDAEFASRIVESARAQPWNENVITHALVAVSAQETPEVTMDELMEKLSEAARGRVALRVAAFAPKQDGVPSPLLESLAQSLLAKSKQGPITPREYENLLTALERLPKEARGRLLKELSGVRPRPDDVEQWRRLGAVFARHGDAALTMSFAASWSEALRKSSRQKAHAKPVTLTAIEAGREGGGPLADLALELWLKHEAEMSSTELSPAGEAALVGRALLDAGRVEGFRFFVNALQKLPTHRVTGPYRDMTEELVALRDLLDGKGTKYPLVEGWTRTEGGKSSVQWRWVMPELGPSVYQARSLLVGDRDSQVPDEKQRDARWWRSGRPLAPLPALESTFRVQMLAGETPRSLKPFLPGDAWPADMPESGCLKLIVQKTGSTQAAFTELRPYSIRPAVFATGVEPVGSVWAREGGGTRAPCPDLSQVPQPASWHPEQKTRWGRVIAAPVKIEPGMEYLLTQWQDQGTADLRMILLDTEQRPLGPVPIVSRGWQPGRTALTEMPLNREYAVMTQRFCPDDWEGDGDLVFPADGNAGRQKPGYIAFVTRDEQPEHLPLLQLRPFRTAEERKRLSIDALESVTPGLPELNDEYIGHLGFAVHSWHVTFASDRGIITGKGALAGFDVQHVPWRPLVRAESPLIEGNEWPMVFTQDHANVIEPSWNDTRRLGLRFVPFDSRGERYGACERKEIPLPTYSRGEISEWLDGAVLMVHSERGDKPEPVCAWVEPDGQTHVVPLPRPPILNNPGLEVAWWGPGGTRFTMHEDGWLFHLEHDKGLRLLGTEPGTPDDMPKDCEPGRSKRKRSYRLERPDVLAQVDKKSGAVMRRFHLPKPCAGTPMAFDESGYVILFTTDHEIIRVNPPELEQE